MIRFAAFLKNRGFRVFQSSIQDALRSIETTGLEKKSDFFISLRSNLVSSDVEWTQFETLFNEFWQHLNDPVKQEEEKPPESPDANEGIPGDSDECKMEEISDSSENDQPPGDREWLEGVAYSPVVAMVEKKDLGRFEQSDIQVANLALKKMLSPFKLDKSRRLKKSRKSGRLDFQKIIRKSLKTGGTPLELYYKTQKKRLKRLVILADVSGSMDRYAKFVMPFLLGLRGIGSKAEVFVFSTSLTPVTHSIRHKRFEEIMAHLAGEVPDWSGGTRIGHSLRQFNDAYGQKLLNRRTVVVVLSDGWDLGVKDILSREMAHLNRKAHSVIWLNPLAGDPDYEPLCRGMCTAMPYIDHFMAADNLESLKRVGKLLSRVMVH